MKAAYKVFVLLGAIFSLVGLFVTGVFLVNRDVLGWFSLLPMLFFFGGLAFMIPAVVHLCQNKMIIKNGKRIQAKIYDYVED